MFNNRINKAFIIAVAALMSISMTSCGAKAAIPDDYNYDDLSAYIKIPDYKGIEYSKVTGDVSDDEVRQYIDDKLAGSSETEQIKEGTVEKDSVVNIDYVGSIDGVEFEGGAAQGVDLDIANSGYIKGFAEGIVGHEVGETFDLHVTFPEDYGKEELNGKPAVFKTTINYLVGTKKAEYNDEWVKNNTEFNNIADYEKSVKEDLAAEKMNSANTTEQNEVFSKIVEGTEVIEYPEKELAARTEQIKNIYADYAKSSGMELDEFLESQMGMTADQLDTMAGDTAKTMVRDEMILYSIKNSESVDVNQEGYEAYLADWLKTSGLTEDTFKEQNGKTLAEYANENNFFTGYLYQEVMKKVMEYSVGK